MILRDVYEEIRSYCHLNPQDLIFRYVTNACTVLSNKGDFEILTQNLLIRITDNNIITLPREVKTPIKVNIDGQPSFSRDRLYEFSMNSVGSDAERPGLQWEDRGTVPTLKAIPVNSTITTAQVGVNNNDASDNGKTITIKGKDVNGIEVTTTFAMSNAVNPVTPNLTEITHVYKVPTVGTVDLYSIWQLGAPGAGNLDLARYAPDETEPVYRQIRLSQTGIAAKILFKRHTFRITSLDDFIPVRSKMGLLYMIKALRMYDAEDMTGGDKMEALAVKFATEEQKSWQTYIELAGATELQPVRNLNINNRDSIIVADVFDDASRIFGPVGTPKLFDKMTEIEEILANKGQWDPRVGYVDILTDQFHYVTLPRYVEEILALNICNEPASFNNQWFEFHLNGPGSRWVPCRTWTKVGDVATFRDVNYPQKLVAIPDLSTDIGKEMRCFGWYQGKRIMTADADGIMQDGFPIDVNMSGATSTNQFVDRIERITRAKTNGFVKLLGFDSSRNVQVTIGYYWPDETEPRYTRIRLGAQSTLVRIKYRKRVLKISALTDPIHLGSKTGFVRGMQALKNLEDGKYTEAAADEAIALKLLEEEQSSSNPLSTPELEFEPGLCGSNFVC